MNTKNNKRKQASTEKIRRVFLDFLSKKDLTQIKVSDICTAANINRSTFYAAYTDIYDLAAKIRGELENDVCRLFIPENDLSNINPTDFLNLFEHIKNNRELYSFYFKLGYDNGSSMLYNVGVDIGMEENVLGYHIEFFKNGLNAIIKMWLKNGCKESPQHMCDILLYEYRGRYETE